VPHPGNEQQSQWLQIRQYQPDWVILWGWGVMNATALKTAQKVGFPREQNGRQLVGRVRDRYRAAEGAANGYYAASLNLAGKDFRWFKISRST
jgi:branched-chain amino acid transport system substrate-binding protein